VGDAETVAGPVSEGDADGRRRKGWGGAVEEGDVALQVEEQVPLGELVGGVRRR